MVWSKGERRKWKMKTIYGHRIKAAFVVEPKDSVTGAGSQKYPKEFSKITYRRLEMSLLR